MYTETTKSKIIAGMPFDGSFTGLKIIGYNVIKHTYTDDVMLLKSEKVNTVFFKQPKPLTAKI